MRLVFNIKPVVIEGVFFSKKFRKVRAVKADYWVICYLNNRCNVNHLLLRFNKISKSTEQVGFYRK